MSFCYGAVEPDRRAKVSLEEIYRLRYQVYVNEWGFERPEDHPGELERDEYDPYSIHFYASTDEESMLTGTARIILSSDLGFPIEKHFRTIEKPRDVPCSNIGEISRLAVSKEYRRRVIDKVIFGRQRSDDVNITEQEDIEKSNRRKCEHEIVRGLYLTIYSESKRLGLTHWYAVMARGLYLILSRWGIQFEQIGPEMDYHGIRAPYLISVRDIEKALIKKNPELLRDALQGTLH